MTLPHLFTFLSWPKHVVVLRSRDFCKILESFVDFVWEKDYSNLHKATICWYPGAKTCENVKATKRHTTRRKGSEMDSVKAKLLFQTTKKSNVCVCNQLCERCWIFERFSADCCSVKSARSQLYLLTYSAQCWELLILFHR